MDLNYLMTSDYNEGLTPEKLTELLLRFRYEYRSLSGKNSSYEKEIEKLKLQNENLVFTSDELTIEKINEISDNISSFIKNFKINWSIIFFKKIIFI